MVAPRFRSRGSAPQIEPVRNGIPTPRDIRPMALLNVITKRRPALELRFSSVGAAFPCRLFRSLHFAPKLTWQRSLHPDFG